MTTNPRCGICGHYHAPMCMATYAVWPTAALIETVGSWERVNRLTGWDLDGAELPEFLTDRRADHLAIRCGLHPEMVWPGWCEAALTESDRRFVFEGGWRQAWVWGESQACDLPAGNPEVGPIPTRAVGGRESGQETAA